MMNLEGLQSYVLSLEDDELITGFKKYFKPYEIASKEVSDKYGNTVYKFVEFRLMRNMLFMRLALDKPFTINNWKSGGQFSQRGLRENTSKMVSDKTIKGRLYLSAHTMFRAFDFDVKGMKAEEVRKWAKDNECYFPHPCRFENKMNGNQINWVHMDTFYEKKNSRVYLFNL